MTLLVTLIFLLADGTPARQARVVCDGITVFLAGDDGSRKTHEGSPLILDSRAAVILQVASPMTIFCEANADTQVWRGSVALSRAAKVIRLSLEEE